jgi:hypothetical protein
MPPRTIADLDVSEAELQAPLRSGRRAEYAHLLCDADLDAETRPFPYLVKSPRKAVAR